MRVAVSAVAAGLTLVVAGGLVSPLIASAGTTQASAQSVPGEVGALSPLAASVFAASVPVVRGAPAPEPGAVLSAAALGAPLMPETGSVDSAENGTDSGGRLVLAAGVSAPQVGQAGVNAKANGPLRAGDRVIIRKPAKDYGSGFLGDYGQLRRLTAPPEQFRLAAASDNGCLIIGDSIGSMSKEAVARRLRRTHSADCAWDTWSGRPTEGTANALADIRATYGVPSTVIVMSGSNDIFNPPLFAAQARRVLALAGPGTRVIWVNVFARRVVAKRYAADLRNSVAINKALAALAAKNPNVQVIDWFSYVVQRTRRGAKLLLDGIHPNTTGQFELGALVAERW